MANDYYEENFAGQSFSLARVEQLEASLKRIQAGFAKLPRLAAILEDRVTAVTASGGPITYVVTLDHDPAAYVDGMAVNVRFQVANQVNPELDIELSDGTRLGAKPIRDVNGAALTAGHIAENVRGELYYVDNGTGYWILGAGGARGLQGPPGPPDGEFYIVSGTTLGFRDTMGTPIGSFGQIAPFHRGDYNAATQYMFLDAVKSGSTQYIHFGLTPTTGTAVTDTSVWQPVVEGFPHSTLTQAAYEALVSKDADTFYFTT